MTPGLYIHIPFCRKKCDYCSFFSAEEHSSVLVDQYTKALIKEMLYRTELHKIDFFDTLYFGGGTPSLLSLENIKDILSAAAPHLSDDAEITMEMNPEDVSSEFLSELVKLGINRVSMGLQSFNREVLKTIGRRSVENLNKKVEILHEAAGLRKSIDLICGIPNQSEDDIKSDIDAISFFSIDHISLYALSIDKGTPLYDRLKVDDSFDEFQRRHLETARRYLETKGFMHYEISNFSKEGCESLHNIKYWTWQPYLGLGAGAHSFIGSKRYHHEDDIMKYITEKGQSIVSDVRNDNDEIVEYIMTSLRMINGFFLEDMESDLCWKISDSFKEKIDKLNQENLILVDYDYGKKRIKLSDEGFFLSDRVIYELAEDFIL